MTDKNKLYSLKRMKHEINNFQKGRTTGELVEEITQEEALELLAQSELRLRN